MPPKSSVKIAIGMLLLILVTQYSYAQKTSGDTAQIITQNIHIPQLNRDRTIHIFLPAGYHTSKQKYPVIYMHDAQNIYSTPKSPNDSWFVDSLVKTMPGKQLAIIVGIDNGKSRITEYNAWDSNYGKAEGIPYTDFIVKTLKPHIDSNYRTKTDAKHTAIAGSSMGGLISMYAAVKYPDVFGTAGIFSPSFWIAPKIYTEVEERNLNTKNRFFLACGDKEGNETDYVNKMETLLRSKGFDPAHVPATLILKDAKHNEQQWRIAFAAFYKWWVTGL
jgi:predicted alpha/beta superfamily hydrolase